MAGFNIGTPPSTSDPKKISNYLSELHEQLRYMFMYLDEENMSEDLLNRLQSIENSIKSLSTMVENLQQTITAE